MRRLRPALMALPLLAFAGCGSDTSRALGFTRDAPDEFLVTTRAPLSVPPQLGNLPVPTPGAPRPQDSRNAAAILAPGTTAAAPTPAEQALVARAGGPVEGDIRRQVDEETLRLDRPPSGTVDRLMNWLNEPPPPGIAVDPSGEAQRLRENAALGRDPGEGQTPIVQPRSRTFLQRLLGT
ncbi:DUF3035 domain-containing protein [Falsiroseomonas bella]|uniref:DUF3035 domain-containing protein n=1 Tax=Falsiroseomonas bella TaxID=2184016 RepID=A0A317FKF7_9PROT|nr:DUF3035 domain-containing protein [Falsiroseomonas bella]PWS38439.1 DUF3035 domain-containing protein [Falsiroseomonas bella]